MKSKSLIRIISRFLILLFIISYFTIWYFDRYVYFNQEQKFLIYQSLLEDRDRFYSFIPIEIIRVDLIIVFFVFVFLTLLYATKFYTYVNELNFAYENKYIDDYLILYLMWNSFLFSSLYVFRFSNLSRAYLVLFSVFVPLILIVFRNSEFISIILGRSVRKENYISFNLDESSNFKNLRLLSFRNEKLGIEVDEDSQLNLVIDEVDKLNKVVNINLIVLYLKSSNNLNNELENYLINLNKKVLIISKNPIDFTNNFIYRKETLDNHNLYYINNDIQFGSSYILKRVLDIILSTILIFILSPLFLIVSILIRVKGGSPIIIKQSRVGLHGKPFNMFKFKTMYNNSHEIRSDLKDKNTKSGPLFKMKQDPRIIKNLGFLRKYSIDELPQLFNVIIGQMSLVGPRPLFYEDTESFDKNYMRRLNVLPGMTGLLQINERNTDDFSIWYKYDIEYIENWSIYLDLKILLKTISVLVNSKNSGV